MEERQEERVGSAVSAGGNITARGSASVNLQSVVIEKQLFSLHGASNLPDGEGLERGDLVDLTVRGRCVSVQTWLRKDGSTERVAIVDVITGEVTAREAGSLGGSTVLPGQMALGEEP